MRKTIHIHIGPHKTGSTAIQAFLEKHESRLRSEFLTTVIFGSRIKAAIKHLSAKEFESAEKMLSKLAEELNNSNSAQFIISSEDISGDLLGSTNTRKTYPNLWQRLRVFKNAFSDFDCRYYFFVRDKDSWLRSVYHQNLRYRTRFKSFEQFIEFAFSDGIWEGVIGQSAQKLGEKFRVIPYSNSRNASSIHSLCQEIPILLELKSDDFTSFQVNQSPTKRNIAVLEIINKSTASQYAKKIAKRNLKFEASTFSKLKMAISFPTWPPTYENQMETIPEELLPLAKRSRERIATQNQTNLMPDADVNLFELRTSLVDAPDQFPDGGRFEMNSQVEILRFRFRGLPECCLFLGLAISYLRRDTVHTKSASLLFQKLWTDESDILLATLPTRWLISSFQTFMEHGVNENQRLIGSSAFFFSNLMKAYEAERALEGHVSDAVYPNTLPQTPDGFYGMDRFKLGGTDLLVNTLSLLLENSLRDEVAGRVLREFLLRLKKSDSVFSRMDLSRQHHNIDIPQFDSCWSFFEEP